MNEVVLGSNIGRKGREQRERGVEDRVLQVTSDPCDNSKTGESHECSAAGRTHEVKADLVCRDPTTHGRDGGA